MAKAAPDSFDAAYVAGARAHIYIHEKNNLTKGLEDLEKALDIDDRKHYFKQQEVQNIVYAIANVTYSEAAESKDVGVKIAQYTKSLAAIERWLQHADQKSLNQDTIYFLAVVYFTFGQGTEFGNEQKADPAMLDKAMTWVDRGLRSTAHPRDGFYQMKVAGLYQLNRYKEMAQYLELELKHKPDAKNNWQQLATTYLQLSSAAEDKKDSKTAYSYSVRAIVTMERAQKLGFMTSPKHNFNIVTIYSNNLAQYGIASDLLEKGLKDGTIESTVQNWQALGGWYQLINRNDKAIEAFATAAKLFPTNAEMEYQLAQVYVYSGKEKEAFESMKACIAKGGTEKPHVGWLLYTYIAMDLQKYDEALKGAAAATAAAKAANASDAVKQAKTFETAILANIQDAESRKQQMQR